MNPAPGISASLFRATDRPDPASSARLLIARAEAEQARIVGEVVDDSIERMAEARERREAERLEEERETDRLRAIERREQADAERVARNAERRTADFRADQRAGDPEAGVLADREQGRADDARRRERSAQIDIRA